MHHRNKINVLTDSSCVHITPFKGVMWTYILNEKGGLLWVMFKKVSA